MEKNILFSFFDYLFSFMHIINIMQSYTCIIFLNQLNVISFSLEISI